MNTDISVSVGGQALVTFCNQNSEIHRFPTRALQVLG